MSTTVKTILNCLHKNTNVITEENRTLENESFNFVYPMNSQTVATTLL